MIIAKGNNALHKADKTFDISNLSYFLHYINATPPALSIFF
jgi:hypothetical protein